MYRLISHVRTKEILPHVVTRKLQGTLPPMYRGKLWNSKQIFHEKELQENYGTQLEVNCGIARKSSMKRKTMELQYN